MIDDAAAGVQSEAMHTLYVVAEAAPTVGGYSVPEIIGVTTFAGLVLWLLRWQMTRQDKRETAELEARGKREERVTLAQEKLAEAISASVTTSAMIAGEVKVLATEVKVIATEVKDLATEVKELRNAVTPVKGVPITGLRPPRPGGRDG